MNKVVYLNICNSYVSVVGFPGGSSDTQPPANAGDLRDAGLILGSRRSPGGRHGNPHILAWRIPWTEEPGGLESIGSQRVMI